jgi:hypothetical protein
MIMPMPFYISGSPVVVGSLSIVVGEDGGVPGFYGYQDGFVGSKTSDSLITYDGTLQPVDLVYTFAGDNNFRCLCDSNSIAVDILNFLSSEYVTLSDSLTTWSIPVSSMSVSGSEIQAFSIVSSNAFTSGDVGNSFTLEFT